jgi:integrase/recombinase XerD
MLRPYERSLQPGLVGAGRIVPVAGLAEAAWSQNLGHAGVVTTFFSYGTVSEQRQAEIIKTLARRPEKDTQAEALTERLMLAVRRELANS